MLDTGGILSYIDPKVQRLLDTMRGLERNADMAVAFHEVWKPAAFDAALHDRIGISVASQAFAVTRVALRREMLMALARIWDPTRSTQSLESSIKMLKEPECWQALLEHRRNSESFKFLHVPVAAELHRLRDAAFEIHARYSAGGPRHGSMKALRQLRHGSLAHTQAVPASGPSRDPFDDQVEEIFQDTIVVATKLSSLINGMAVDHASTAHVYADSAARFWASARGENTPGHPHYRQHPS